MNSKKYVIFSVSLLLISILAIGNLEHYMDTIHFDTYVADCMTDYISNPENKMNKYTYMEEIDEFEKFIREYDYSVLL